MFLVNVKLSNGDTTTVVIPKGLANPKQRAYQLAVENYPPNERPLATAIVPAR